MSFFSHLFYAYFLQFDTLPIWLLHLKIPSSTHESLMLLLFVSFFIEKYWTQGYSEKLKVLMGRKEKSGISSSNHNILLNNPCNNFLFFCFFCNLRICANLSILCTLSWSNTFQIPTQKRVVQQIHFSFYLHYIVWLPIMNFLLQQKILPKV